MMTQRDLFWRTAGAALVGAGYVLTRVATEAGADLVGITGLLVAGDVRQIGPSPRQGGSCSTVRTASVASGSVYSRPGSSP